MNSWSSPEQAIEKQLYYTIGLFNGVGGVSRLDKLEITDLETSDEGELKRVKYTVKLPVSIRETEALPAEYELELPLHVDYAGEQAFFETYGNSCVDYWAHDYDVGIYWYYYRPERSGCSLADEDVVRTTASVVKSPDNTLNKYPEHDRIWEDDTLRILAIYGKVEDGTTTDADRGIWSYNLHVRRLLEMLPGATTTPADLPDKPGVEIPDITIEATLEDSRRVVSNVLLVDNVRHGGPEFESRYNELSTEADIIVYNGHAGLGANIRKLASLGNFRAGKYQIFYMNGCDTFAYIDGTLAETRSELNPDDPSGTKYMEIITNSMPPNWDSLPTNTLSLVESMIRPEPLNYKQVLAKFDQSGIVSVVGEEDNTFTPSEPPPTDSCAHALCEVGTSLDPTCDPCAADIAEADGYCRDTEWDQLCVDQVESVCGRTCG
jgi:hypothetical protein